MENNTKIAIGVVAALIGFALWRNYGVKPKGDVILDSAWGNSTAINNTKEQKELIEKIQAAHTDFTRVKDGETLTTSYGKYKFIMTKAPTEAGHYYDIEGYWTKYAEVWENFANAAGSNSCVFFIGDELVNGKISSYDPNICVSGSQRGIVYSEQKRHDIL
jgi:hypothetical protein